MRLLILVIMGLSLVACDNATFSSSNSNGKVVTLDDPNAGGNDGENGDGGESGQNTPGEVTENGDLIFLDDSFERDDLFGDIENGMIVGWRGAWDDHGTIGLGFTGNQLGMEIFSDQEMGPAYDGERATYFYGRPGSSVHTLWLVSPTYDLSDYNTVIMNYRYLTIALNDQEDIDAGYIEGIKLQVCTAGANECGANSDFIDVNRIGNAENWVTVAESDVNEDDDNFDGTNHTVSDYITDLAVFDLNDTNFVSDKSEVVIRFEVTLRDGFAQSSGSNPNYDEKKCERYTHKKEKYCEKAEKYQERCDKEKAVYNSQTLLTQTGSHKDKNCGKHQSCKKAKHYGWKCEHYTEKQEKYCDKGDDTRGGTLEDGVILDLVQGLATERDISEIF